MAVRQVKFDFSGKKAFVTGASRGIGRGIVSALVHANIDKIYALARDPNNLAKLKRDFPCVETIAVDLADWEATKAAVKDIDRVDFLLNNAAINRMENNAMDTDPNDFDLMMNTNVKGALNVSQQVCRKMLEGSGGAVVNVSSLNSHLLMPGRYTYTTTKVSLDALTRQLALEFAPKVRVNGVNPQMVISDMTRPLLETPFAENLRSKILLERFVEMEEMTDAILFLLSDGAGMVNGHCLPVTGGIHEF